jgi:hypothetical protein
MMLLLHICTYAFVFGTRFMMLLLHIYTYAPCVFLGYSSSHLGYRCLDLESHRIYISHHVCFHENVFPFAKSEQVTSSPVPPTQPTYLPSLNPPPCFQPTTYQTSPNNNLILLFAAPH